MPVFEPTGRKAKDLWLVDGSPDFAHFPGGLADHIPEPLPIWLRVGTSAYGEVHIRGGARPLGAPLQQNRPRAALRKARPARCYLYRRRDGQIQDQLAAQSHLAVNPALDYAPAATPFFGDLVLHSSRPPRWRKARAIPRSAGQRANTPDVLVLA